MNAGNEDPQFNEENHDASESVVAGEPLFLMLKKERKKEI